MTWRVNRKFARGSGSPGGESCSGSSYTSSPVASLFGLAEFVRRLAHTTRRRTDNPASGTPAKVISRRAEYLSESPGRTARCGAERRVYCSRRPATQAAVAPCRWPMRMVDVSRNRYCCMSGRRRFLCKCADVARPLRPAPQTVAFRERLGNGLTRTAELDEVACGRSDVLERRRLVRDPAARGSAERQFRISGSLPRRRAGPCGILMASSSMLFTRFA